MLHRRELSSSSSSSNSLLPAELASPLLTSSPHHLSPHVSGWWEPAHLAESSPASWLLSPLPPLPSLAAFSTAASHDSLHSELGPPSSPVLSSSSFLLTPSTVPNAPSLSLPSSSAAARHTASARATHADTDTSTTMTVSLSSIQQQHQQPRVTVATAKAEPAAACATVTAAVCLDSVSEQHRRGDKQRRRKEQAALRRLEELCGSEQLVSAAGSSSHSRVGRHQRKKSHKLSVLQKSAVRIERLERLLTAAELSARVSDAQLRVMSEEINSVVLRERQLMQWMDASRTLNGMSLLGESVVVTLLEVPTGRLLNANQAFFSLTGFTPGGSLSRQITKLPVALDKDIPRPLVKCARFSSTGSSSSSSSSSSGSDSSPDELWQWVPLRSCQQYPRTVQLLQDLMMGERESFSAPYRCRWADDNCYEIQANFWLADVEVVEEADGRKRRRPLSLLVTAPSDTTFRVDGE